MTEVKKVTGCEKNEKEVFEMHSESEGYRRKMFHKSKGTWGVDKEVLQRFRSQGSNSH